MKLMFNHCYKLKEIKGINKFNTSKVNNMGGMFQYCSEIEYLDFLLLILLMLLIWDVCLLNVIN